MFRRKQRPAFDQVSEFDRVRIVAYRDCGLSFREIVSRVGRKRTTVLRICDRSMQEGTTDRRGRSHPPSVHQFKSLRQQWCDERRMWVQNGMKFSLLTSHAFVCNITRWSDSTLETPQIEKAEQLRYASPHWSCTEYYGIGRYWISLSPSSSTPCRYFKEPALRLQCVGASCPSLPSGLGHSHIPTGLCVTTRGTYFPKFLRQQPDWITSLAG
ncbi:transposable element Tcb1 transposase [Trichonephila clavipes]|uniref:Transposable element Tcb1 transposase n=1 Tax=Trichonephila clavipes TaxID=2585209 RepID=A0A8X6S8Z8_TRICX|nr:transposable element Tcb1 transposase [Trichonephila clavipes]